MNTSQKFAGAWFDGRTARQQHVAVTIGDAGLVIRDADGAERAHWPADEVRLTRRRPGDPLRLRRGEEDAARLTVNDAAALGVLLQHCPQLHRRPGRLRDHWRPVALWGGGALAAIAFMLWFGVPWLATLAADAVPPETEARWGEELAGEMAALVSRMTGGGPEPVFCETPAGRAALDRLTARLTEGRDMALPLRVRVLRTPMVNALALPGGQIFVLSGLIDEAGDSGELAGVLAHEIGHVERRHPIEAAFKSIGIAALLSFLVGDVSGGTFIVLGSQALLESAFSRDAEREADESAIEMLNHAGIAAGPMADFFDRLTGMEPDGDDAFAMISTHPPSAERAATIRAASTGDTPSMSAADWQAIRAMCEE